MAQWISLCNLCVLCVSVVISFHISLNHRDTENTEVAQRRSGRLVFLWIRRTYNKVCRIIAQILAATSNA